MKQYYWVLFNNRRKVFYQNRQLDVTDDMLLAEKFKSYHAAKEELDYLKDNSWTVKKVIVAFEE